MEHGDVRKQAGPGKRDKDRAPALSCEGASGREGSDASDRGETIDGEGVRAGREGGTEIE